MRYRYLDDFRRGISVFAIFSYGIVVLGTPQCPPQSGREFQYLTSCRKSAMDETYQVSLVYLGYNVLNLI